MRPAVVGTRRSRTGGSDPWTPQEALHRLLQSLYSEQELRRLFRFFPGGPDLTAELPGAGASLAHLALEAVLLLERHGLLAAAFARMRSERPHRLPELLAVQACCLEAERRCPRRAARTVRSP